MALEPSDARRLQNFDRFSERSYVIGFLVAAFLAAFIFVGGLRHHFPLAGGIAEPSGRALYLQGESCVVNADVAVDREDFDGMLRWCLVQYDEDRRLHPAPAVVSPPLRPR